MPLVSWTAAADGRYWIDVEMGGEPQRVMVDLGLVDPLEAIGFEVEPALYEELKRRRLLSRFQIRFRRDANAMVSGSESGMTTIRLLDPVSRQAIGPATQMHICKGVAGIPSRVGVAFFHQLTGCEVRWQLDSRNWQIAVP